MILYGSTLSPFVRKVAAVLAEKGIDYDNVVTRFDQPDPTFLKASPMRKMPAIKDGDYMLADSSAIIHYLDAKYPEPSLIPAEAEARGKAIWYEEWADTVFVSCGAKMFFNRIVAPRFLGRPGDLEAAAVAEAKELPGLLDYLETVVPEPGGFLVGERLTIADLAIASPFANLAHLDVAVDSHPRTAAYISSILERPSFAPLIARETAFLVATAA